MRISLLRQRKNNDFLAFIETLWLTARNRFSRQSCLRAGGPVVILTTHGRRLATVHLTLESIARGRVKPSRLILALDDLEAGKELSRGLQRLKARGLEVVYGPNIGPHQKYYLYIKSAVLLDSPLVTADDDVMYPCYWLDRLFFEYRKNPELIHCYRAHRVMINDGEIAPYSEWDPCRSDLPSFKNFATGVSGVIYPPKFQLWLKHAGDAFKSCCPHADDIWLHANAIRCGIRIHQISSRPIHFVGMRGTQEIALHAENVTGSGNDRQIDATYTHDDMRVLLSDC